MISVIIPCYNSEAFVARAIESVLLQTYPNYEIILVDNNSTDNTATILADYARKYPEKIKVFSEYKKGAPAARNKGLSEARGEWIQFLDSDDELLPEKFERQIALITDKVDIIVGPCYKHKTGKNSTQKWIQQIETKDVWKGLLTSRLGNTCANLWKTEALLAVSGWNETVTSSEEYDLLFRMLKNDAVITFTSVPLLIVHMRGNSVNRSSDKQRMSEILNNYVQLRLKIKDYLREHGKLTNELNRAADINIYLRLISYREKVPAFYKKTLHEINLKVPFFYVMKFNLKLLYNKLSGA